MRCPPETVCSPECAESMCCQEEPVVRAAARISSSTRKSFEMEQRRSSRSRTSTATRPYEVVTIVEVWSSSYFLSIFLLGQFIGVYCLQHYF